MNSLSLSLGLQHRRQNGSSPLVANNSATSLFTIVGRPFGFTPFSGGEESIVSSDTSVSLPAGITFLNGAYSGTLAASGSFTLTGTATDQNGLGNTVSWSVSLVVAEALTITQSAPAMATVGIAYDSGSISVSGGHGAITLTSGALPDGLGFMSDRITGTPTTSESVNITLTATDSHGFQTKETVSLTIGVNQAPIVADDNLTTAFETAIIFDPRANDSDPEGQVLTVIITSQPSNGTAVRNTDNTITYTPNMGYSGLDTFTYTVNDGSTPVAGQVNVTVNSSGLYLDNFATDTIARYTIQGAGSTLDYDALSQSATFIPAGTFHGIWIPDPIPIVAGRSYLATANFISKQGGVEWLASTGIGVFDRRDSPTNHNTSGPFTWQFDATNTEDIFFLLRFRSVNTGDFFTVSNITVTEI